jgi:hypothetical protein
VVDAWLGSVYTQEEFCIVNKKSPHYDMSNDFSGKISATIAVRVDGESLLPSAALCLV